MGRHAAGPPDDDPAARLASAGPGPGPGADDAAATPSARGDLATDAPAPASTPTPPPRPDGSGLRPRDALLVAALVAAVTAGVLLWAGSTVWVVVLGALGAGVLVPLAAWVARTVPGPDHPVQ